MLKTHTKNSALLSCPLKVCALCALLYSRSSVPCELGCYDVSGFVTDAPGLAVIITNNYIESPLNALKGTTADGDKMQKAFHQFFKFDYLRANNLYAEEMKNFIQKVANCSSLQSKKCIVFVFSGHGGENGSLYGQDGKIMDIIDDILLPFDPQMAPDLKNIPKLFFIDACRGGVDTKTGGKGKWSGKDRIIDASKGGKGVKGGRPLSGGYIIGYATMSGYRSYLRSDSEAGSLWMPLLADELQQDPKRDVLHVLVDVNIRLNEETGERIVGFHYQQPHFHSTYPGKVNLFRISGMNNGRVCSIRVFYIACSYACSL